MESLDVCLAGGLHRLGLLEQFKLNTLVHHWRDVVGPVFFSHTKIVDIKPPLIVISADNSQWMQEIKMNEKKIIAAINEFYKTTVITDMRMVMQRKSYVVDEAPKTLAIYEVDRTGESIDLSKIPLSDKDMERIDQLVQRTENEELSEAFRKVLITSRRKEIYLEQQGYRHCERCHVLMNREKPHCVSCEYELYREHINDIKTYIRRYPYMKYSDCQQFVNCTFPDFSTAMRELIYFYLDKIYKGSISRNHMYMAAMLITHKKMDELTDAHVINLCNKYRSKFLKEEEQKKIDALSGKNEWE